MPAGVKTRQQLVARALGALGVAAAGQAPAAEDVELVDGYVDPLITSLQARGISDQIDPDEVPDEIYLLLSIMLADMALTDFGMERGTPDDPNSWSARAGQAEALIRSMTAARPTYALSQVEYF